MKAQEIRQRFTEFFIKNDHKKIQSSSLVPHEDPTLLFANAGMNQFKNYFLGTEKAHNPRAVSIQKCVRAGGKHNDLENVGFTARHHTFFEMLGNFSFGDYFKQDAIRLAWDFLTKELKIPESKLLVTVHHTDDEAFEIWHKSIGIDESRIFRKGDKDNFWEMGEFGPCGPCSEIFFDHGEAHNTPNFTPKKGQDILDDEARYVEIWNLVFMQFEKTPEGTNMLPNPSIDTGAGLERIAAALQGKYWNYDTDIFLPILKEIEKISGKKYSDDDFTSSMRIVADHIRSSAMLITDGVIPSNEGRGYVLRRIIRRAVRHLRKLEAPPVSFYKLINSVFETLGTEYPQNSSNKALAEKLLQVEEEKFLETLDQGLKFLNAAMKNNIKNKMLPGNIAFKLYDTFGFPVDLTETILQENNLSYDKAEFDNCMEQRKADSRKSWKGGAIADHKIFFDLKEKVGETKFLGYETTVTEATLLADETIENSHLLIFDQTPFYAESGGQVGDTGKILLGDKLIATIDDTQKPVDGLFIHLCDKAEELKVGSKYTLSVDVQNRNLIACNHTATHLLQSSLGKVLGDHVKQAGSLVSSDKLRFDYTHPKAMTTDEISKVEELVNQQVRYSTDVDAAVKSKEQAIEDGATALFGEKYDDEVRTIKIGEYSHELCGGTHVNNTGDIGYFSIISDSALSTGIRRIEALTSTTALDRLKKRSSILANIESLTNEKEEGTVDRIQSFLKDIKAKQKELSKLQDKLQSQNSKTLFDNPEELVGSFVFKTAIAPAGGDLRKMSDRFVDQYSNGYLLLYSENNNKLSILLRTAKQNSKVNCSQVLKEALKIVDGRGGGRPDMAQGSATDNSKLDSFISKVKELLVSGLQ